MIEVFFADCPEEDEHRYGHALARYSLERLFGRCELILKPHMKPEANLAGAYLSISHSVNVCAVAASDIPVGLDIELTTRNADRLLKLAERFFSPDEFEYVKAMPEQRFYEIWCKKESYVKYTGEGFRRKFPGFSVFDLKERFSSFEVYGHFGCVCSYERVEITPKFVNSAEISAYL